MKVLFLILATVVVGALCEEKCVPGTTFMEDCNRCRCGNDGQKACTRKMCPPNELSDDALVRTEPVQNGDSLSAADEKDEVHLQTNGQVCSPNEIKMQDCNRCRCANNGIGWFCTRRTCPQREKRAVAGDKCTPGTNFMADDGCNTCYCNDQGKAACTRIQCQPSEDMPLLRFRREDEPRPKCTPGTTFKAEDGCNTCFCNDQGVAACSLKFCPSQDVSAFRGRRRRAAEAELKCTPGTTFKRDCNTCYCDEQGRAACTLMGCLPAAGKVQHKRKAADVPRSDIAPGAPGFSCTPKSYFKYQCNTCVCMDNGKNAGCTFKLCLDGEW